MRREWSAVERIDSAVIRGMWLRSPEGEWVARFPLRFQHVARQCAAAMNITTTKQRQEHLAKEAGFTR